MQAPIRISARSPSASPRGTRSPHLMKKTTLLRFAVAAAMGLSLAACDLAIDNPTAGDQKKVLASPDDAENLASTYWKRWHSGLYSSTTDIEGMANNFSLMNYSSLANNCQN